MIKANNADLLQQMIINNENEELLFSQKVNEQKKCKYEELAEKIQSSLDLFYVITATAKTTNKGRF